MEFDEGEGEFRTPEEVRKIIKIAKLHESELTEVSQVLRLPDSSRQNQSLRLMTLDKHLLQVIEKGGQLSFKGDPEDNVVLCTDSKTYHVKEAETSNSLLLVPELMLASATGRDETNTSIDNESDSSFEKSNSSLNKSADSDDGRPERKIVHKDVIGTFFTYYEIKPCKPRLAKLQKLLQNTCYQGPELEYAIDKASLLNYEQILKRVQASKEELEIALEKIQAIEIDGHYRLLEFDFEFRVLSYMLDLLEENSWPLNGVLKDVTMDSLNNLVPHSILEAMFRFYTTPSEEVDGVQCYQYKEDKVCRFLARVLLKSAGKFNLVEFMQAWRDSVPEGMVTEESFLSGIALLDKGSTPQVIWAFSEADLPEDINERFRVLFQTKPKWTVQEISPYIECYATEKINVNALLTKYARASTLNGVRVFSSKHMT